VSEREVYDMLRMHYEVCYDGCKCPRCSEVHEAIAESKERPDVVKIMRWIVDRVIDDAPTNKLTLEHAWALGYVKRWIEEEFHVRLTDGDRYEWVDE